MNLSKRLFLAGLFLLTLSGARAELVCRTYNPDGSCAYWWDPGAGKLTPGQPGQVGDPTQPGACSCIQYNEQLQCVRYSC